MMHFNKWPRGAAALLGLFLASQAEAQVVKNERLLSFEDGAVPAYMVVDGGSRLAINDEHYKDGLHSLGWEYGPGDVLSVKKDLMFEKKDPTGKDTYLALPSPLVSTSQAGVPHGCATNAICRACPKKA